MELRTTFTIQPSKDKITYNDPVMFIGSCFAASIGSKFELGHMPVMINPAGTVYNPVSICNTLDIISNRKIFTADDLCSYDGTWLSFYHYTDFSLEDQSATLEKINSTTEKAYTFLQRAKYLFITLGTARVYRLKKTGMIVSNCHKMPSEQFEQELLTVDSIVSVISDQIDILNKMFPELKVIFTISPVRHWKDGAFGNQLSKSVLFVAVNELLKHKSNPGYFPAYELVMDDLRDYRFYAEDMLHPADSAVNYIWEAFEKCYFDTTTSGIWNDILKLSKAFNHRPGNSPAEKKRHFAEKILGQISDLEKRVPHIDLSREKEYFLKMRNQ